MINANRNEKTPPFNTFSRRRRFLQVAAALIVLSIIIGFGSNSWAAVSKDAKTIQLNFKSTPIETVLEYLSETAGVVVVSGTTLSDRITVISKSALDLDEAVALINSILKEKGYTAIMTGRTLKVVSITDAKKMNLPVTSGSNPEDIEPTDEVVTHIIPIRHATASSLAENLASLIPETADFSANSDTNTLIITDTKANIRRIVEIVAEVDGYMAAVAEMKVFRLEFADAEDTADLINDIFEEQESASSAGGGMASVMSQMAGGRGNQQSQTQGGMPGGGGTSSSTGTAYVSVSAKADERTNSVVVSAPEDSMAVIEKLITDLDSDATEGESLFVYPLKNAQAENLVDVLNELFGELSDTETTNSGASDQRQQGGPGGMAGGQTSTSSSTSSSELAGEVTIQADEDTNSLLILTTQANYAKVVKVLDELDKPVPQVLIKVLIAEVTHDDGLDVGTEFSYLNEWQDDGTISLLTDGRLGDISSTYIANIIDSDFDVKLKALAEDGKLNILSKPYILASNNQEASITVGQEFPFVTDTRTTDSGQTINTIEYEDIGIILEVTPYINDEGLVIMDLSQEISSISATTVAISDTVDASVISKRSSENRVIARDGQTVVIGGLMQDQESDTIRKVPLLGDIPLLGYLFKHREISKTKTELLIFLTPTVAVTDAELAALSETEKAENKEIFEEYTEEELDISSSK
jgi:general secretion pathway protein D